MLFFFRGMLVWQRRCQIFNNWELQSKCKFQFVFGLIVSFLLSFQILLFLSSFWHSDGLPTIYITCPFGRVSVFVKIAAECA